MSGDSASFYLLDERIQRFIWAEGWESLRDAQEAAIPLIVKADRDVIVAAATAAGKTEAAFLPALTHLLQSETLGLIVNAPRANRVHVTPVGFGLRIHFGVAIDFGCGRKQEARSFLFS